jgi:hypothetical protein
LEALLLPSVLKILFGHALIEKGQLQLASLDPIQETSHYIQTSPGSVTGEPLPCQPGCVKLNDMPVRAGLQAPKQSAPAQYIFRNHVFSSADESGSRRQTMPRQIQAAQNESWGKPARSA